MSSFAPSISLSPQEGLNFVREIESTLDDNFEATFGVWVRDGRWRPLTASAEQLAEHLDADHSLDVDERFEAARRAGKPVAEPLGGSRYLLLVPACGIDGACALAAGLTDGRDPRLMENLASAVLKTIEQDRELGEQRRQIDSFARQVSDDFEELMWLRKLAECMDGCDATGSPTDIMHAVLPSLQELIKAETLAMVPADRPDAGSSDAAWSASAEPVWTGPRLAGNDTCRRIVERFGPASSQRPFVTNRLQDLGGLDDAPSLRACILVPIAGRGRHFGWLLALNKQKQFDLLAEKIDYYPVGVCEEEFGTFEASLMDAASVIFATHLRNITLFHETESLLVGVIRSLINTLDARDTYTFGHSDRVALIACRLAEEIGLSRRECQQVFMAGLLHDIGKVGVPDSVLTKPGRLTDAEFEQIKLHPVIGHSILKHLEQIDYVLPAVLHHHESVDGSGYPHGLAGEEIPLSARILAVADAYDAMTSSRPYRQAMSPERAESILAENSGTQWDAGVVDVFFRILPDIHRICDEAEHHTQTILNGAPSRRPLHNEDDADSIFQAIEVTCAPMEVR